MHSFSRKMRTSAVAAFTLMLTIGAVPAVTPTHSEHSTTPAAHAQSAVQAPVTVNSVTRFGNTTAFTINMTATKAMSMENLEISTTANLGSAAIGQEAELSVNGKQYSTDLLTRLDKNTLEAEFSEGVEVQPGTPITVRWTKGQRNFPKAGDFTAIMRGTEIATTPPAQGNPIAQGNFSKISNSREWDACQHSNSLLYSKTWWDNTPETAAQGGVDVIEVKINGVSNLADKINTADSRLELRFGSSAGWTNLDKDRDYSLTVSGNSVYFELHNTQQRASLDQVSYDVEARIPLSEGSVDCEMTLWHRGENLPEINPAESENFVQISNDRTYDACTHSGGILETKTWWDNSSKTMQQGNVNVVRVKVDGETNLANRVDTSDSRFQLHFGSDAHGWTRLRKGADYYVKVSGDSVYFVLRETQERAPESVESYDVKAFVPISGASVDCKNVKLALWNYDENAPQGINPDAPTVDVDGEETPREQLEWLPASSKNPERPQRCGLNIALVFDSSDSVFRQDEWPVSVMNAGLGVINALEGTGSQMSIYNFASEANSIPQISAEDKNLNDAEGVKDLRNAVKGFQNRTRKPGGRGGTNYEAGLKQIPENKFDIVYFVTDGLPTTSDRDYPGEGFDVGELSNQSDLSRAVEQANRLKDSGTRIETVTVGFSHFKENILKDDYFNYNDVSQKPDKWPKNEYGFPAHDSGAGYNVRDMVKAGRAIYIFDAPKNGKRYDVTNQPEFWRAAIRDTHTMAADISSPDAVTSFDKFDELAKSLSELVLKDCFGSINVTKLVHGEDGQTSPAKDWTFETSVQGGQKDIIDGENGEGRAAQVTDTTNEDGHYGRSFDQKNGKGQSVTVVEHQQAGYKLHKQGGKNAVCTTRVNDGNSWKTKDSKVSNIDDAQKPGFGVEVPFRGIVNCTIENDTVPVKIDLSVEKVSFEDKPQPLAGSEFTLNKVDGDNREQLGILRDGAMRIFDLQPGNRYELVENQAPSGYQLLSRPIYFNIVVGESGKPEIQIEGGAEQYPEISIQKDKKEPHHSVMQVADIRKGELPYTGGRGLGGLALLASIVAAAAVFIGRRALN